MQEQVITTRNWSEIRKQYPESQYIHVLPAEDSVFSHGSPQWRLDVTIVKFDADDEKEVYAIEKEKRGDAYFPKTVGLTKGSLERLCAAAGISVIPSRIDDRRDPLFAEFRAVGALATKGGEPRVAASTKAWNGNLRQQVKVREAEKKFDAYCGKGWAVYPGGRKVQAREATTEQRQQVINEWFQDEWLREQEYGPATAESKAMNRVRRALLGISAKYAYQDVKDKSFIVPRWMFEPDISNEATRQQVIAAGLDATRRIFPLLGQAPAAPMALPPAAETYHLADLPDDDDEPPHHEPGPPAEPTVAADDPAGLPGAVNDGEPDDADAISPNELSFYIAQGLRTYNGDSLDRVNQAWDKYVKINNPTGFAALRQILRHVLKHQAKA